MIAQVVVNRPLRKVFDYEIPAEFLKLLKKGHRVEVNFAGVRLGGYVVGLKKESRIKSLRKIEKIIDEDHLFSSRLLTVTREVARYYLCGWGEVLEAARGVSCSGKKVKLQPDEPFHRQTVFHKKLNTTGLKDVHRKKREDIIGKTAGGEFEAFLYQPSDSKEKIDFYLRLIRGILRLKRSVMLLVPEVMAADSMFKRLELICPEETVMLHSRLTQREKDYNLRLLKEQKARLVIGTRSAVFAPLSDLGLIIVDEEESELFKKPDAPKFNAQKAALIRAEVEGCPVVLSSLTPSVESYYYALKRKYIFIGEKKKAPVSSKRAVIVDLRAEEDIYGRKSLLSFTLREKIEKSLKNKKSVVLLYNRRGFSTFIRCDKCGYNAVCPKCRMNLVYHYDKKKLLCHHCNYNAEPPKLCPECKSSYVKYSGFGTEKFESVLSRLYPASKVERLDVDTARPKGRRQKILSRYNKGDIDILIGTRILSRGVDFKNTGLIGIISADTFTQTTDFRGQEKLFRFLYMIINRAVSMKEIEIVIQTHLPTHFAIEAAVKMDRAGFYERELKEREELELPPFYHFNCINLRGKNEEKLIKKIKELNKIIRQEAKNYKNLSIIEAEPVNILKQRESYRQNIILKGKKLTDIYQVINKGLKLFKKSSDIFVTVDIDSLEYF